MIKAATGEAECARVISTLKDSNMKVIDQSLQTSIGC